MSKKVIIFICFLGLFFSLGYVFAQNENARDESKAGSSSDELWQRSLEELRANLGMVLGENQELRQKEESFNNRITELEGLLKKSETEKDQVSSSLTKSLEELNKVRNETEMLQKDKTGLEKQLADAEKNKPISQLNKKNVELELSAQALKNLEQELAKKNSEISKLKDLLKNNEAGKPQLANELKHKELEIETKQAVILKITKEKERWEKDSLDLKKEISRLQKNPLDADKKIMLLQDQIRQMNSKEESLKQDIDVLKNDLAVKFAIIEDLNKQQESSSREKAVLESLLKLRAETEAPAAVAASGPEKAVVNHELTGYSLAREGRLDEAIEEYKKAISSDPHNKDLYYNLAYLYSRVNNFNKAIENYNKVLKSDPRDEETLYNLSKIYEQLRDEEKSRYYYEAYLKLGRK